MKKFEVKDSVRDRVRSIHFALASLGCPQLENCWDEDIVCVPGCSCSTQVENRLGYCDRSLGMGTLIPAFISLRLHKAV